MAVALGAHLLHPKNTTPEEDATTFRRGTLPMLDVADIYLVAVNTFLILETFGVCKASYIHTTLYYPCDENHRLQRYFHIWTNVGNSGHSVFLEPKWSRARQSSHSNNKTVSIRKRTDHIWLAHFWYDEGGKSQKWCRAVL